MGKGLFDLEKHFAFYGAYHSNPVNVAIHMLFVWPIFYTSLILFHFTPSVVRLPFGVCNGDGVVLNLGFVFALVFAVFYVFMDQKAGSLAAVLCIACWVSSDCLAARLGFSLSWKVVLASQLFCWSGQFLGHALYEKRAPALLDNLPQALMMAPFFVLLELLQRLCGYEPYPGFRANIHAKIAASRAEWQAKKEKKDL
ncbi:2-hydroxy-palmitic acid dioxygenase MPO1-like [Typha latifolia]|uniref:2-hydroxy-palmitic acid dioxygenase MPO1-like n=1 Tax=Typha latifolia TaxID=4733 RepID=UPI003C2F6356